MGMHIDDYDDGMHVTITEGGQRVRELEGRCPTCGRPEAQFFRMRERGPRCNDPFHFPQEKNDD